jgi:hypothetical protein
MLKIEDHHQNGDGTRKFVIKASDPGSGQRGHTLCECASIEELHEAINHYYRAGPRSTQHAGCEIEHCPLCRKQRKEMSKPVKLRLV